MHILEEGWVGLRPHANMVKRQYVLPLPRTEHGHSDKWQFILTFLQSHNTPMETQERRGCVAPTHSTPRHWIGVSGQRHTTKFTHLFRVILGKFLIRHFHSAVSSGTYFNVCKILVEQRD
jgi:hypothetical protein